MTFSSASLSACDVEDVAATAAGATCLRGGGRAACWRVAGARTGGAGAGAAYAAGAAVVGALAAELLDWPRHPPGTPPVRWPAPGSWPVRSIARRRRGRKGSRHSSAAANHSIGPALGLFD